MAQHLLGLGHAGFGELYGLVLLVDEEVTGAFEGFSFFGFDVALRDGAGLEPRNELVHFVVEVCGLLGRAGNDRGVRASSMRMLSTSQSTIAKK